MERMTSLNDLLMEELAGLLNVEHQVVEVLPKMIQASQSVALKALLENHLKVSKDQAGRLRDIFSSIGQNPQEITCETVKKIITESEVIIDEIEKSQAHDAVIISMVRRLEQYEIAGYQVACEHAANLGHTMIVEILNKILNEEQAMDLHLNELSQYMMNVEAINPPSKPKSGGFYIPQGKFKRGGIKKKSKNTDVSRFIGEGNPNVQEPPQKGEENNQS